MSDNLPQRNFALIVGVSPQEIEAWFHAAFVDAHDCLLFTVYCLLLTASVTLEA